MASSVSKPPDLGREGNGRDETTRRDEGSEMYGCLSVLSPWRRWIVDGIRCPSAVFRCPFGGEKGAFVRCQGRLFFRTADNEYCELLLGSRGGGLRRRRRV